MTDPNDQIIDSEVHETDPLTGAEVISESVVSDFIEERTLDRPGNRTKGRRVLALLLIVLLIVGGFFAFDKFRNGSDSQKVQGKVALSASELRDVVLAKKLTVFWAGPVEGDKYSLVAVKPGVAYVRYLPGGVGLADTQTQFRAIGTYSQKNAYAITQSAGNVSGNVGFINADGNAVFYIKTRPTNVYLGIPKLDLQIEVFDPGVDQALGLALIKNQIRKIT